MNTLAHNSKKLGFEHRPSDPWGLTRDLLKGYHAGFPWPHAVGQFQMDVLAGHPWSVSPEAMARTQRDKGWGDCFAHGPAWSSLELPMLTPAGLWKR